MSEIPVVYFNLFAWTINKKNIQAIYKTEMGTRYSQIINNTYVHCCLYCGAVRSLNTPLVKIYSYCKLDQRMLCLRCLNDKSYRWEQSN